MIWKFFSNSMLEKVLLAATDSVTRWHSPFLSVSLHSIMRLTQHLAIIDAC